MITITLKQIRKHGPCRPGWEKLLKFQGKTKAEDEPFPFSLLLKSNGLDDALWALRCLDDPRPAQLLAIAFAQEALDLMKDQRSQHAVKIAHLYLYGEATREELTEARITAYTAYAAAAAATDAAYAAYAAADVAYAARISAAYAATDAADAAAYAAYDAASRAADTAEAAARAYVAGYKMQQKQAEWVRVIMDNWE
jgi:hypothetical protein